MRRRSSRGIGLFALYARSLPLCGGLALAAACPKATGEPSATPGESASKAPDPTARSPKVDENAPAPDYPDRETPYDAYVNGAHLRVGLRVHNPMALAQLWNDFSRSYGVTTFDLATAFREGLYAAGVPGEVLDAVDPAANWALELDYPLRTFDARTWAFVPAKAMQAKALAEGIARWMDMAPLGNGFWHAEAKADFVSALADGPAGEADGLPANQRSEGTYLGVQKDGVVVGLRAEAVKQVHQLAPASPSQLLLLELEGFATAIPDLLEEFDFSPHSDERALWSEGFAAVDRAYLSLDRTSDQKGMAIELGAEGRLDPLNPGLFGALRHKPAPVASLMPAGALVATTFSWGDPSMLAQTLRAGTRGPNSSALEREFGEWSDALIDRGVQDVGVAIYVDDRGHHAFVVALPGNSARGMKDSASTFLVLAERTLRSLEASLIAREAAGEISKEEMAAGRLPYKDVRLRRRGGDPVSALEVTLNPELLESSGILANDQGVVTLSSFEHKGAFFFSIGPGTAGVVKALGRTHLADMPGFKAAHELHGGCQVCGVVDGSRNAASLYGRHRRNMTPEKRKEAEGLVRKLRQGGQSPVSMRIDPARARFAYVVDMSLSQDVDRRTRWESFMRVLGARGEALTDPREWHFGQREDD